MTMMTLNVEVRAYSLNCFVELTGQDCRVWLDGRHAAYTGTIAGLQDALPQVFNSLIERQYVKPN